MNSLFRTEVLDAQRDHFLGPVRIGCNPTASAVTLVSIICAFSLLAFATWAQVTRKARVAGILLPQGGALQVTASAGGLVRHLHVIEGQTVEADQTLFVIGLDRPTQGGETAALVAQSLSSRRATLQAERSSRELLARQRVQGLDDRLRSTEAELRQAETEAELFQRRVELAKRTQQRYQQLARDGFVSEVQAQQRQEELIDLQGRVQAAERSRTALARDAQSLRAERAATAAQLQTELAQVDRALSTLDQEVTENDARRELLVRAPQRGSLTAINVHAGQTVLAGQTLATLVPQGEHQGSSELQAQLFAPSRTTGFVRPGQSVWMRYAAYPYQKFGLHQGRVISVSQTPISAQDLPAGQAQALLQAAQSSEPLYRITVGLAQQSVQAYGQAQALKAGMALEADILQDRRAIWEWLMEPLLAVSIRNQKGS